MTRTPQRSANPTLRASRPCSW